MTMQENRRTNQFFDLLRDTTIIGGDATIAARDMKIMDAGVVRSCEKSHFHRERRGDSVHCAQFKHSAPLIE
jgi:hypothetical protein